MRVWLTSSIIAILFTGAFALAILFSVGWLTRADIQTAERACVPSNVAQKIPDASIPEVSHIIVEQYKAYVSDLGALGAQFGTTQTFYLTVVSGLLALLALKEAGRPIQELQTEVSIGVFLLVTIICASWFITELRFDDIFSAKFRVLCHVERSYPAELFPLFTEQSQLYRPPGTPGVLIYQIGMIWAVMTSALTFVIAGVRLRRSVHAAHPPAADASSRCTNSTPPWL
jgi:hypothetical protein